MNCIGCGCSEFSACHAGGAGCHWISHNPPVCSQCIGLFDDGEIDGAAFDNVMGANDDAPRACLHEKRLYVDELRFKCCSCETFFCDEAA